LNFLISFEFWKRLYIESRLGGERIQAQGFRSQRVEVMVNLALRVEPKALQPHYTLYIEGPGVSGVERRWQVYSPLAAAEAAAIASLVRFP